MAMTLQEISDRMEIEQLFVAYSDAVDSRDWDALDDVFTPDAVIDYTEMGAIRGDLPTIKEFLESAMGEDSDLAGFQHLVATSSITIDGERAQARTICFNPMAIDLGNGETHVYFNGLWYRDELVHTAGGWRISERYEEKCYKHNRPPGRPSGRDQYES